MEFGEVSIRFYERQAEPGAECYHIVRLAIPRLYVLELTMTARDAYCFTVFEPETSPTAAQLAQAAQDGQSTTGNVFPLLPTVVCLAAVYQFHAFPAKHMAKLAAEAVLRRFPLPGIVTNATFPPGTIMNGMLMPPSQIIRMAFLMEAAHRSTSPSPTEAATDQDDCSDSHRSEQSQHREDQGLSPTSFSPGPISPSWPQF